MARRLGMRKKVATLDSIFRFSLSGAIVIYHLLYWNWKQHLDLLEDMGQRLVDFVLFISAVLFLINSRWLDRLLLALNAFALICYGYIVEANCGEGQSTSSLFHCSWF